MLPDFTTARKEIEILLLNRFNSIANQRLGVMNFKKTKSFEARHIVTVMEDGEIFKSEMKKISGQRKTLIKDITDGNIKAVFESIDKMALEKAEQEERYLIEELTKTCQQAGQVTDNAGKPFDSELFFKGIEKMQIEFNENGDVEHKVLLVPPPIWDTVNEVLSNIEKNPQLKKKYKDIIENKRVEWRDREASRKLVG